MNTIVAQANAAWHVVQGEPALLVFATLILAAVLLVVILVALPTKRAAAVAGDVDPRPRIVRDLARRGKSAGEIARRTGLARDAITLAVAVATRPTRQSRPAAARSAVQRKGPARGRTPVVPSYPMSLQRVR